MKARVRVRGSAGMARWTRMREKNVIPMPWEDLLQLPLPGIPLRYRLIDFCAILSVVFCKEHQRLRNVIMGKLNPERNVKMEIRVREMAVPRWVGAKEQDLFRQDRAAMDD